MIEAHPELLGLGIDEATAVVVQGDRFEVIGKSVVGIYDGSRPRRQALLLPEQGRALRSQGAAPCAVDANASDHGRSSSLEASGAAFRAGGSSAGP